MNRRMPNGMYGGVRGGLNSPYSIYWIKGQYYLNLKYINGKWMTILTGRGYFVDKGTK